ncbi:alpha/beta fold hydrolase [Kocuria atrinae]|uniref:alpha/beta hydrolase n=1 Tax=Kocuria atrinae TaxID=592377 RepID=UPI001CB91B85
MRILLVHGAGGNSDAFWPYAAHFASLGAYVTVPDLPGYGMTVTKNPGRIRYDHWRELLIDLIRAEDDERPLIILGASMGGLLAYDAAAATGLAARLIVTCLLDPRDPRAPIDLAPTRGAARGAILETDSRTAGRCSSSHPVDRGHAPRLQRTWTGSRGHQGPARRRRPSPPGMDPQLHGVHPSDGARGLHQRPRAAAPPRGRPLDPIGDQPPVLRAHRRPEVLAVARELRTLPGGGTRVRTDDPRHT